MAIQAPIMDARSEANLMGVHPDLCKVMRLARQTPQPFVIIHGLRTLSEEQQAIASGHSQTIHSRHFPNKEGFGCAVDVDDLLGGRADPTFAKGHEAQIFGAIALQVKAAAAILRIPIQWGGEPVGAWTPGVVSHFRDWGHFQLTWEAYP